MYKVAQNVHLPSVCCLSNTQIQTEPLATLELSGVQVSVLIIHKMSPDQWPDLTTCLVCNQANYNLFERIIIIKKCAR